jgi:hypothetical protein
LESGGTVEMDLPDLTEFTLDTIVTLKAIDVAGPRIDLVSSGQRLSMGYDNSKAEFYIKYFDGTEQMLNRTTRPWPERETLIIQAVLVEGHLSVTYTNVTLNASLTMAPPFDTIKLSNSLGGMTVWHKISIVTPMKEGTIETAPITPLRGNSWNGLELSMKSPPGASAIISLVDADSNLTIDGFEDLKDPLVDLTDVFVSVHPRLKLRIELEGDLWSVPSVDWCRVDWEELDDIIVQIEPIADILMEEDSGPHLPINLSHYFRSRYIPPDKLSFRMVHVSDDTISPVITGSILVVSLPTKDWNGMENFTFECYTGEKVRTSEPVWVIVSAVDDPPVINVTETLQAVEDVNSPLDLLPYIHDVDTPFEELVLVTDDVTFNVSGLQIQFFYHLGDLIYKLQVSVYDGNSITTEIIDVYIEERNDLPIIDILEKITRDENLGFTIDLSDEINDEDDPDGDLVLECDHPAVTGISGLEITFYFDLPGDNIEVPFTVSDGGEPVEGTITFKILDIPEPGGGRGGW